LEKHYLIYIPLSSALSCFPFYNLLIPWVEELFLRWGRWGGSSDGTDDVGKIEKMAKNEEWEMAMD
jgi:hypothetical protein